MKNKGFATPMVLGLIALVIVAGGIYAVSKDDYKKGEAMKEEGAAMDAMPEGPGHGDAMMKEGDAMKEEGAMMEKDAMKEDGAMMEGEAMMKEDAMMKEEEA